MTKQQYIISYSTGHSFTSSAKTLCAAKKQATKNTTYEQELNGIKITIYLDDEIVTHKSYCKFTTSYKNLGKWA